jgi:hypothetical protein
MQVTDGVLRDALSALSHAWMQCRPIAAGEAPHMAYRRASLPGQ